MLQIHDKRWPCPEVRFPDNSLTMAALGQNRRPTFFWQGLLIMLPVAVLAGVGLLSIRQDRLLAEHEAAERAQSIADDLLPRLWTELAGKPPDDPQTANAAFEVDSTGRLVFPPSATADLPPEPLDPAQLGENQRRRWFAAQRAEATGDNPEAAIEAYRAFLADEQTNNFAAAARYALALLQIKQERVEEGKELLVSLLEGPEVVGESGLPLGILSRMKLIELNDDRPTGGAGDPAASLDGLCSNAVYRPTLLSPFILNWAQARAVPGQQTLVAEWQRRWQAHEFSRHLFAAASAQAASATGNPPGGFSSAGPGSSGSLSASTTSLGTARMFWFNANSGDEKRGADAPGSAAAGGQAHTWLAMPANDGASNCWFICRSEQDLGAALTRIVNDSHRVPDFFGVGIELAGRKLSWPAPDLRVWRMTDYMTKGGGGQRKEYTSEMASQVLASAAKAEGGVQLLRLSVYLTSPGALFAHQRIRTLWFGLLVGTAAAVALVGLLAAYRAFHRQIRLSELKSNFVSSVSHELRAPIASVRLMAESLDRGKIAEGPKQREYFRFIVQECRRLSALIENVLDFSRIEQGRKRYDFEPTDLAALAEQTTRLMEPYAAEREVQITVAPDCAGVRPQPVIDSKAIQQALINLLDNAIKHSSKGQVVTVGWELQQISQTAAAQPGKHENSASKDGPLLPFVALWVEDHGEGIPLSEHEKIFERFYRRGSELRRETSGVGIGLSIVKHIVEAHHGRIRVRSDVGQGSRFTLELPIDNHHER